MRVQCCSAAVEMSVPPHAKPEWTARRFTALLKRERDQQSGESIPQIEREDGE